MVAVDRDPVARELTRLNAAALGLTGVEVLDADVVDLVAAAADGRVAGCDAAVRQCVSWGVRLTTAEERAAVRALVDAR